MNNLTESEKEILYLDPNNKEENIYVVKLGSSYGSKGM